MPQNCILYIDGGSIKSDITDESKQPKLTGVQNSYDENYTLLDMILPFEKCFSDVNVTNFKIGTISEDALNTEDIDLSEDGKLQLADREYDSLNPDGMGYVILRKNLVEGVNTLTQDMFYKDGPNGTRVPNTNTIYVIRYDFTLGEDITVPENCVLKFDGGSLSGAHTLTGANTGINADLVKIFNTDVTLAGSWNVAEVYPEWFGADNKGENECSASIQLGVNFAIVANVPLSLRGTLKIGSHISIKKRITIEGNKCNFVTNNSNLDCFILFDNIGKTYATYGDGNNIVIKNIRLDNSYGSNAVGIKFLSSSFTGNVLDRIHFSAFRNPCILFAGSGVLDNYGAYAHNIQWKHIITNGCSTIINRTSDIGGVYIYGGTIDDIQYEGVHENSIDEYNTVLDMRGFYNTDVRNIILEGVNNMDNMEHLMRSHQYAFDIHNLYFELQGNAPTYSLYLQKIQRGIIKVQGLYGNIPAPIYLNQVDLLIESLAPMNLRSTSGQINADNLISNDSVNCTVRFNPIYLNDIWRTTDDSRVLPSKLFYDNVVVNASQLIRVDESEPMCKIDLSELAVGTSGEKYGNKIFIAEDSGYEGKTTVVYGHDIFYGDTLQLIPTADDNFLHCKFRINYAISGFKNNQQILIAITLKCDNAPEFEKWENTAAAILCYPSHTKTQNVLYTMLLSYKATSTGALQLNFENAIPTGRTAQVAQSYTIYDISIFNGWVYGKCPSKKNTILSQVY